MYKKRLLSKIVTLTLVFLMVFSFSSVPKIYAIDKGATDVEPTDKEPTLKYFVEVKTSTDNVNDIIFDNTDQYVENYKITFYDDYDDDSFKILSKNAVETGETKLEKDAKIKLSPKKANSDSLVSEDEEIELPLFASDDDYEAFLDSQNLGNHFILRSITTNLFYASENPDGSHKIIKKSDYKDIKQKETEVDTASILATKLKSIEPLVSVFRNGITTSSAQPTSFNFSNSDEEDFTYMYSTIYAYDEYNSARTQKRHKFDAYHIKYDIINEDKGGYYGANGSNYYVNTTKDDTKSDVAVLAWTLGGAIASSDSSIYFHAAYNKNIEYNVLGVQQSTTVYSNLYNTSSQITKHNTAFTGTSIAYNMPDYVATSDITYGNETLPVASIEMGAIGGWYNVGSYNGANGVARSEYIHSFSNSSISVSLGFSIPTSVGVSVSGATTSTYEKAWVYTTISPN